MKSTETLTLDQILGLGSPLDELSMEDLELLAAGDCHKQIKDPNFPCSKCEFRVECLPNGSQTLTELAKKEYKKRKKGSK